MSELDDLEEVAEAVSLRVSIENAGQQAMSANGRRHAKAMRENRRRFVFDEGLASVSRNRTPSLPKLKFMGEK